jgi:hypothetical protein
VRGEGHERGGNRRGNDDVPARALEREQREQPRRGRADQRMNSFPRVTGEAQTVQPEAEQEESSRKPDDDGVQQSAHAGRELHQTGAAGKPENGDRGVEVESAGERGAEQLTGEDDAAAYHSGRLSRPCRNGKSAPEDQTTSPGYMKPGLAFPSAEADGLDGAGGLGLIRTEGVFYCLPFLTCSMTCTVWNTQPVGSSGT